MTTASSAASQCHRTHPAHQFLPADDGAARPADLAIKLDSRSRRAAGAAAAGGRSSSIRRRSKACICASAASPAAACAGRDRREDFRTEILGLVKAQQVKNAVIVPVGAKGGFYPKLMPANPTREQFMETGIAAYKTFVNALLDVTDNLDADGQIVPPPEVLRPDGDDPYLVVAADKGTATFSDIANSIAAGTRLLAGRRLRHAAAASAMTTRRWASPPAAPGKR